MAMRLNWLDRGLGYFAPRAALRRGKARAALDAARGYDGASIGRRTSGWRTPKSSADAEIYRQLATLRNRSRDLSRNNPWAKKAKSVWVSKIVGTGIWPRSANKQANDLFKQWAAVCDADGQLDFAGLQRQIVGEMIEAGDALVRRRLRRPEDNLPVPLQLQVIEGDLLDETRSQDLGQLGKIINGVEFNPIGQRSAYWLFADHPGNFPITSANLRSNPVPASEIIHLYDRERSQARGVPWCSAIILPVRDLTDYSDAERVRKKSEACVVGFVTDANGVDPAEGGGVAPTVGAGGLVTDRNGNPVEQFEPGLIAYVSSGRDIKFNNPTQSDSGVDFMKLGLHEVAAGYRVPYELLTGDLAEVNFTSFRAGNNQFETEVETSQWLCLVPMALNRMWDWFCEAAWLAGKISQRFIPVEWDTPVFKSVQPLDDVNTDIAAVRAGFDSLLSVIGRRTGRNPVEVLEEIAESNRQLDRLELVLDCDPRRVAKSGIEQIASSSSQPPPARPRLASVA